MFEHHRYSLLSNNIHSRQTSRPKNCQQTCCLARNTRLAGYPGRVTRASSWFVPLNHRRVTRRLIVNRLPSPLPPPWKPNITKRSETKRPARLTSSSPDISLSYSRPPPPSFSSLLPLSFFRPSSRHASRINNEQRTSLLIMRRWNWKKVVVRAFVRALYSPQDELRSCSRSRRAEKLG